MMCWCSLLGKQRVQANSNQASFHLGGRKQIMWVAGVPKPADLAQNLSTLRIGQIVYHRQLVRLPPH